MSLTESESIHILQILREARAAVSRDAEAFHLSTLALEKVAHIAGANVGCTLGPCGPYIVRLFDATDAHQMVKCSELFDTVLQARNMAIHDGAWVRHHSSRLVDLFILIEELMITGMQVAEQVMVRSPLEAKPWHRVAHCRNDMLSNSFSVLPILTGPERWELPSDEAIVQMVAGTTKKKRHDLLSKTVEDAVSSGDLVLTKASLCGPRDPIEKISRRTDWPLPVVDEEPSRLLPRAVR